MIYLISARFDFGVLSFPAYKPDRWFHGMRLCTDHRSALVEMVCITLCFRYGIHRSGSCAAGMPDSPKLRSCTACPPSWRNPSERCSPCTEASLPRSRLPLLASTSWALRIWMSIQLDPFASPSSHPFSSSTWSTLLPSRARVKLCSLAKQRFCGIFYSGKLLEVLGRSQCRQNWLLPLAPWQSRDLLLHFQKKSRIHEKIKEVTNARKSVAMRIIIICKSVKRKIICIYHHTKNRNQIEPSMYCQK